MKIVDLVNEFNLWGYDALIPVMLTVITVTAVILTIDIVKGWFKNKGGE